MGVEDDGHHAIEEEDEDGERVASPAQPCFLRAADHTYVLQTDADFRKGQDVDAEDLGQQRKVLLFDLLCCGSRKKEYRPRPQRTATKSKIVARRAWTFSRDRVNPQFAARPNLRWHFFRYLAQGADTVANIIA